MLEGGAHASALARANGKDGASAASGGFAHTCLPVHGDTLGPSGLGMTKEMPDQVGHDVKGPGHGGGGERA